MSIDGSVRALRDAGVVLRQLPFVRVWHYTLLFLMLLLVTGRIAVAASDQLDTTIEHLIAYVQESGVTFKRNFSRHNSVVAAEHIEKKYQYFHDDIDTPEKFIELCATRSLVTGNDYLIMTIEGEKIPAGVWLNAELNRYRIQQGIR